MRFALCLGGNLWGASPDAAFAERAMGKIDTVVYLSTSLNTGHAGGLGGEETIILPVLARDEEPEPSTQESMFSYIRLSDGGKPRHPTSSLRPRAEVEIIAELARRVLGEGGPVNWHDMAHTSTIRRAIASDRAGPRADRRDRQDEEGVFDSRPGPRHGRRFPRPTARPISSSMICRPPRRASS